MVKKVAAISLQTVGERFHTLVEEERDANGVMYDAVGTAHTIKNDCSDNNEDSSE